LIFILSILALFTFPENILIYIYFIIADPADRITPTHQPMMLLECMEEGILYWNDDIETTREGQWLEVGTVLGKIVDEKDHEGVDEEWKWQAYLHDGSPSSKLS